MKRCMLVLLSTAVAFPALGQRITLNLSSLGNYVNPPSPIGPIPAGTVQTSPPGLTVTLETSTDFLWFTFGTTCVSKNLTKTIAIVTGAQASPINVCLVNLPTGGVFFGLISAFAPNAPTVSAAADVTSNPGGAVTAFPITISIPSNQQSAEVDNNSSSALSKANITFPPGQPTAWLNVTETGPCSGLASGGSCNVDVSANTAAQVTPNSVLTAQIEYAGANGNVGAIAVTYTVPGPVINAPLQFIPVTPCRIADTRNAPGPFGGPILSGGVARDFAVPSSSCVIPANAQAYALNVTVVPSGALGYLTLWPSGESQPSVSVLNSLDGRIKANAAIVPAGVGGAVTALASNDTDIVLDINGYFVPASGNPGLTFYPLTQCRVADTRTAPGTFGEPSLVAGQTRDFPISQGGCNVPPTARAYSVNFTVVPAGPLGYLSVWPSGQNQPVVSTLNDVPGTVVANAAIVPAGANGSVSVYASNNTDVLIDVNGYFAPPGPGGLALYNVLPCRVLDTRAVNGGQPLIGQANVNVAGSSCGIPSVAQAFVLNATVVPSGPLGYLVLWPYGQPMPSTSTLNSDGSVTSNLASVSDANGSISAYVTNATQLVIDVANYFAP